jgi:hypothetical protein
VRLGAWLPTNDAASPTAARMQFSGGGLDVYLCAAPAAGARATLWACAQGGAAALRGTSSGGLDERTTTAPWYTAGVALRAEVRLSRRVALEGRVEGVGSLTRPEFSFTSAVTPGQLYTNVYTVPVVVPAAALGLSLTL